MSICLFFFYHSSFIGHMDLEPVLHSLDNHRTNTYKQATNINPSNQLLMYVFERWEQDIGPDRTHSSMRRTHQQDSIQRLA